MYTIYSPLLIATLAIVRRRYWAPATAPGVILVEGPGGEALGALWRREQLDALLAGLWDKGAREAGLAAVSGVSSGRGDVATHLPHCGSIVQPVMCSPLQQPSTTAIQEICCWKRIVVGPSLSLSRTSCYQSLASMHASTA
jgi:hypothetical protein